MVSSFQNVPREQNSALNSEFQLKKKIPPFWAEWKTIMTKVHGKPRALALLASWCIKWVAAEENTVLLS